MGKNKGAGKKSNVFKVAGAKSLKAKSKAKPVTGNLKKINEIVRTNINKIDKELISLQSDLRNQKKKEKVKSKSNQVAERSKQNESNQKPADLEREKEKTLKKLEQMQF